MPVLAPEMTTPLPEQAGREGAQHAVFGPMRTPRRHGRTYWRYCVLLPRQIRRQKRRACQYRHKEGCGRDRSQLSGPCKMLCQHWGGRISRLTGSVDEPHWCRRKAPVKKKEEAPSAIFYYRASEFSATAACRDDRTGTCQGSSQSLTSSEKFHHRGARRLAERVAASVGRYLPRPLRTAHAVTPRQRI
jgi:hypothetical protein